MNFIPATRQMKTVMFQSAYLRGWTHHCPNRMHPCGVRAPGWRQWRLELATLHPLARCGAAPRASTWPPPHYKHNMLLRTLQRYLHKYLNVIYISVQGCTTRHTLRTFLSSHCASSERCGAFKYICKSSNIPLHSFSRLFDRFQMLKICYCRTGIVPPLTKQPITYGRVAINSQLKCILFGRLAKFCQIRKKTFFFKKRSLTHLRLAPIRTALSVFSVNYSA